MQSQLKPKILVFGGTLFIGKAFLDYAKKAGFNYEIHCLNRGTAYWNNVVRLEHPEVIHHYFDRNNTKEATETLLKINSQVGISQLSKWKAIVDFSCYNQSQQEPLKVLEGLAEKYLVISTDSVYNNSCGRVKAPVQEKDFNLEAEFELISQNSHIFDEYGQDKMKCEINLAKMGLKPYVCLRLPDVIGEYDLIIGRQRFWCTMTSIANCQSNPIPLNKQFKQRQMSFVDAYDVAITLNYLIQQEEAPKNTAYNLSFVRNLTYYQFCQIFGKVLGKKIVYAQSQAQIQYFYPSVQFGTVDCNLAKSQINWNPTPIEESITRIAKFYLEQGEKYIKQKELMHEQLNKFYEQVKKNK